MNASLIDEGPHHAVFLKPAGMVVVAGRGVPRPTLLDVAIERFGPGVRPVHRVDKPTSGLCIVAKTTFGQQALSDAFRRHLVDKRYLAILEGAPAWNRLDVDARLSRVDEGSDGAPAPAAPRTGPTTLRPARKGKGPLAWQTIDPNGVRALTRLFVLSRGPEACLVEARPETGRMHQIRVHVSHVGHPIVGDPLYGARTAYPDEKGLALVAFAVSFPLPQGGRAFVVGGVPTAFRDALAARGIDAGPIDDLAARFRKPANAVLPLPRVPPPPREGRTPAPGGRRTRGRPARRPR